MPPVTQTSAPAAGSTKKENLPANTKPLQKPVAAEAGAMAKEAEPAAPQEAPEAKAVREMMEKLSVADKKAAAAEVAAFVKAKGVAAAKEAGVFEKLSAAMTGSDAAAREGAVLAFAAISEAAGRPAEPYLVTLLPALLERHADKVADVRTAAQATAKAFLASTAPQAVPVLLPALLDGMDYKLNWQTRVAALNLIKQLIEQHPVQIGKCLPTIIPVVSYSCADAKPQVKSAAMATMQQASTVLNNKDIEHVIPAIISCIGNPNEVSDCVHKLAATTFVQAVEAPTLSLLVPLLVRGLRERQTAIKRKSALIIDNMVKLVENPDDAHVFLPRLLPGLETAKNDVPDPECRSVAARAHATLLRVAGEGVKPVEEASTFEVIETVDKAEVLAQLKEIVGTPVEATALTYVAATGAGLIAAKDFEADAWKSMVPVLAAHIPEAAASTAVTAFLAKCFEEAKAKEKQEDEDEHEGEELCDCEFSLAYGAKILLHNTRLHLKRGRRYGLCGANGTGKSTLMRAINNEQVDGFPPRDALRTVFVEHDIDSCQAEMPVLEYVLSDPVLQDTAHPGHSEVESVLESVGFDAERRAAPVASLSGGWKMKLALARAMLMHADILLLDEPTNHLDVTNVKWLEDYLNSLPNVTSMIVSHDSGFLDNVCTDIIHYEDRKLKRYGGNLSEFVKRVPSAKSYYELGAATTKFRLPEPGFLEGVKNKDKAILKMTRAGYTYPGATKVALSGIVLQTSLNSRVACIGPNGAGKSTLIKLLTGETEPSEGTVWRHPNLRIAYVAQHAFHHLEKHLDKTPNQYIQWRYAPGEDREAMEKETRQISAEEQKAMDQKFVRDGVKKEVEKLHGRRKNKKGYEYEVEWKNEPGEYEWLLRAELEEMGFSKLIQEIDIREAANMGMIGRPLTQKEVEKQLMDLGIEPEFGSHSHIRGLSGGQKVKVVVAAAMWMNPHMLVMDEPTNYLDRESLGALAEAIKEFGGGVVIISHNREFCETLCPEVWNVNDGTMVRSGDCPQIRASEKIDWKMAEEATDALGNTIKIKAPKKQMSRQELKKYKKVKAAKKARGEEVSDSDDE